MTITPERAARREHMVELREGGYSLAEIGEEYGISRQRVHQILKAVKLDAQRERCRSGVHGDVYHAETQIWQEGEVQPVPTVRCCDCGAELQP